MDPKTAKCRKINLCEAEDQSFPRTDAVRPATASVQKSQLGNISRGLQMFLQKLHISLLGADPVGFFDKAMAFIRK